MSFQQIIIVGNLGRDPEMRYTPSGVAVTRFSVAVTRSWTGQDGQKQEKTVWFNVSAWRKQAEFASQYLTKGQSVIVIGEVEEARVWQDQSGNHRADINVTAETIRFNGPRPGGAAPGGDYGGASGEEFGGGNGGARRSTPAPARGGSAGRGSEHDSPDDIPF